ncbi:MAG: hypothetical protein WBN23_01730 [Woeseia sp.]
MGPTVPALLVIAVNLWASISVARKAQSRTDLQLALYFALIWLLPLLGAAVALIANVDRGSRKDLQGESKLFEAVVEKRKSLRDESDPAGVKHED